VATLGNAKLQWIQHTNSWTSGQITIYLPSMSGKIIPGQKKSMLTCLTSEWEIYINCMCLDKPD